MGEFQILLLRAFPLADAAALPSNGVCFAACLLIPPPLPPISSTQDGHSFNLNAGHILQAGGGGTNNNMQEFKDMRLDKLSYQEYHKDYPHEKYTIGFSGRPGEFEPSINS